MIDIATSIAIVVVAFGAVMAILDLMKQDPN